MSQSDPASHSLRRRRRWLAAVGLLLSAGFLVLAARGLQLGEVADEILKASIGLLALTQVTKFLGFLFLTARSGLLLRSLHSFPASRLLKSHFVAFVGNSILPARLGELLRVGYIARHGKLPLSSCVVVAVVERTFDSLCLLALFFCAASFHVIPEAHSSTLHLTALALGFLLGAAVILARFPTLVLRPGRRIATLILGKRSQWLARRARDFQAGLGGLRSLPGLCGIMLLTAGYWLASILTIQVWLWAFGLELAAHAPLVILLFIALGSALPSTSAQIGTYHYFAMTGLMLFDVSKATAASIALVGHALAVIPFTLIGALLLLFEYWRSDSPAFLTLLRASEPASPPERHKDDSDTTHI